jgi:hypothetical protein
LTDTPPHLGALHPWERRPRRDRRLEIAQALDCSEGRASGRLLYNVDGGVPPNPSPDMSLKPKTNYSFADYLAAEREAQDVKHEYLAGEVFAMTGASFRHNLIVANVVRHLGNQLAERPCTVLANDMRVHVEAMDLCAYPDIAGLCGEPSFYDEREDVLTNPALIIEVLSKSTRYYSGLNRLVNQRDTVTRFFVANSIW